MPNTSLAPIAIIILTWNGLELTQRCLRTLREQTAGAQYRIIVVDNGSTDGTVAWLRAQPDVELIANASNVGYTRGNNQGLRALRPGEDVLLLNNDTELIHAGWLARLQAAAYSNERAGVVGCRQISHKGLLMHAGTYMPTHTLHGYQVGGDEVDVGQYPGLREVEGVVGSCMYIRHDCLADVGPLDEQFFSYYEDTDYCLRAKQRGWQVLCAGDVTIVHAQNASTALNHVSLNAMFARSQATFVKKWIAQYERQYRQRLFWHGVVGGYSSYAVLSRQFVLALDAAGVDVRLGYLYGVDFWEGEEADPRVAQLKARPKDLSLPQVVCHQGDAFYKNSGRYKIGFTMMDVDGLDEEWVRQCNQLHEVWVPSEWSRQTFAESGVRVPIHLVPLGVDTNYFHPGIKSQRFGPRYTFLSVFEWGERKAPELLLRAWGAAFTRRDDVQLVLKITNNDTSVDVAAQIAALNLPTDMAPLVILYNENIPGAQMGSLYRAADCFVLASRGEGWGMPVLEAMACGLPTIATDWGGTTAFLRDGVAYPLRTRALIPAVARCRYYPGFRWADPDVEHLVYLLRHTYQNQAEARAVGERAAAYAQQWTWEQAAGKIVERLEALQQMERMAAG